MSRRPTVGVICVGGPVTGTRVHPGACRPRGAFENAECAALPCDLPQYARIREEVRRGEEHA